MKNDRNETEDVFMDAILYGRGIIAYENGQFKHVPYKQFLKEQNKEFKKFLNQVLKKKNKKQ